MTAEVRKANIEDIKDCRRLIYLSGPLLFCYFFLRNEPEIYDVLKPICEMKATTFSYENVIVNEVDGKITGMVLGFPVSLAGKMEINLWRGLYSNQGLLFLVKYILRAAGLLTRNMKLYNDEFFISNISVY